MGVGRQVGIPVLIVVEGGIRSWGLGWAGSLDPSLRSGRQRGLGVTLRQAQGERDGRGGDNKKNPANGPSFLVFFSGRE